MTLEQVVAVLERTYSAVRAEIVREMGPTCAPELVRDTSGRYVLLDALTALTTAKSALR